MLLVPALVIALQATPVLGWMRPWASPPVVTYHPFDTARSL